MKKIMILAALLFSLTLVSCKEAGQSEWETFCPWLAGIPLTCDNIDPPKIEYFYGEDDPFHLGYYDGGDTIFINDSLSSKQTSAVIVHEIVHYLQVQNGLFEVPGPIREICFAEEIAFSLTDVYREYLGLDKVGDDWWKPYPYCWQYYAPAGSRMIILELPDGELIIEIME